MNKEEIIKYLKEKIKTNQSFIKTIEKIDNDSSKTKDDIINNSKNDIKYYKEIINYIGEKEEQLNIMSEAFDELERQKQDYTQINILEMKLEEKDKVIDEAIEYINQQIFNMNMVGNGTLSLDRLLEILERGKNGK